MNTTEGIALFLTALRGVKSPATVEWYENRLVELSKAFGACPVDSITTDDLRAWRSTQSQRAISAWTLHGNVRAAKRFFKWLVEEGHLQSSGAARLELPHLPMDPAPGIAKSDMQKMIRAAADNLRDYALCKFLADSAARVGGLVSLRIENLDFETGRATVREKGSKSRTVYFSRSTGLALLRYLGGRKHGPVFLDVRQRGEPLTVSGVYQLLQRLARRCGVEHKFNPHAWRHGVARRWLQERGANLGVVSQLLGHADVGVTVKFYGTFADEDLRRAHQKYTIVSDDDDAGA
ncbi:MAG: tyrosine-type recombinase/integrase [Anaerolineales bacterium]|nr:tyrosine-type recombinase/integrase [Anaerolineales bacterium]